MPSPYTTAQREAAFDAYYTLGEERSLLALSQHLVSIEIFNDKPPKDRTLGTWSIEDNWQQRVIQRDLNNAKKVQERTDKKIVDIRAEMAAKVMEDYEEAATLQQRPARMLSDMKKDIEEGKIRIESTKDGRDVTGMYKDLDQVKANAVKKHLELLGEAGEIVEHQVTMKDIILGRRPNGDSD